MDEERKLVEIDFVAYGKGACKLEARYKGNKFKLETESRASLLRSLRIMADWEDRTLAGMAAAALLDIEGPVSLNHGRKILALSEMDWFRRELRPPDNAPPDADG